MRILVGCEFSGVVRDAFLAKGHDAISCDLIPSQAPGPHILDDVLKHLNENWDMGIFFPPCTHLCISGARWFKDKAREQAEALQFVKTLLNAPIPRIAIENPVGVISTRLKKPSQIIQPWQFGHGETKATCLWLKGLPKLTPTNIVTGRQERILNLPDSKGRAMKRSMTYPGIALAMSEQWSRLPPPLTAYF